MCCTVCRGRGEVEAGITGGTVEHGPVYEAIDWRGRHFPSLAAYPTTVRPNPDALYAATRYSPQDIWFLDVNPLCKLWSTALCARCRGTGMG